MSEKKHTPGPWKKRQLRGTFDWIVEAENGHTIAEVTGTDADYFGPQWGDENAGLIAGLPELLDEHERLKAGYVEMLVAVRQFVALLDMREMQDGFLCQIDTDARRMGIKAINRATS